jgi:hypothetical protein
MLTDVISHTPLASTEVMIDQLMGYGAKASLQILRSDGHHHEGSHCACVQTHADISSYIIDIYLEI